MRDDSDEQLAVRKRPDWLTWLIVVVVTIIGVTIIALWWYCLLNGISGEALRSGGSSDTNLEARHTLQVYVVFLQKGMVCPEL